MTKKDITTLQKVVSCIPQVYFDIIGRVIPGTLIMGSVWIAVCGPMEFLTSLDSWLNKSKVSTIIIATVLVLLTSYILAIFIWCVWSCVTTKILDKPEKSKSGNDKSGKSKSENDKSEKSNKKRFRVIYWDNGTFRKDYEELKYKNNFAGNRVTKLKAQIHMAETLFIGLLLSCLVGIITYWIEVVTCLIGIVTYFYVFSEPKLEMPSLLLRYVSWVLLLLAAVCSLFARQYFILHMNDSLENNLDLLKQEKKPSPQDKDETQKNRETNNSVGATE